MARRHKQMRLTECTKYTLVFLYATSIGGYRMIDKELLDGTKIIRTFPGDKLISFMINKKLIRRKYMNSLKTLSWYTLTPFGKRKLAQFIDIEMIRASCTLHSL